MELFNVCESFFTEKSITNPLPGKDTFTIDGGLEQTAPTSFACSLCPRTFTALRNHTRHMKAHFTDPNEPKKFVCVFEGCKSSFVRKGDLQSHVKWHTETKKEICSTCDKRFHRKSDLLVHERRHLDVKPYACKLCPRSFSRKWDLSTHEEKKHSPQQNFPSHARPIPVEKRLEPLQSSSSHIRSITIHTDKNQSMQEKKSVPDIDTSCSMSMDAQHKIPAVYTELSSALNTNFIQNFLPLHETLFLPTIRPFLSTDMKSLEDIPAFIGKPLQASLPSYEPLLYPSKALPSYEPHPEPGKALPCYEPHPDPGPSLPKLQLTNLFSGVGMDFFSDGPHSNISGVGLGVDASKGDLGLGSNAGALLQDAGETPLHAACRMGHADVVKLLLQAGVFKACLLKEHNSPLHIAISNGHCEIALLLVEAGCRTHFPNSLGETPLYLAATKGYTALVARLLLDARC